MHDEEGVRWGAEVSTNAYRAKLAALQHRQHMLYILESEHSLELSSYR